MTVKIISKPVKICPLYSFPDVLESENSHAFRRIFLGANFLCLNYF